MNQAKDNISNAFAIVQKWASIWIIILGLFLWFVAARFLHYELRVKPTTCESNLLKSPLLSCTPNTDAHSRARLVAAVGPYRGKKEVDSIQVSISQGNGNQRTFTLLEKASKVSAASRHEISGLINHRYYHTAHFGIVSLETGDTITVKQIDRRDLNVFHLRVVPNPNNGFIHFLSICSATCFFVGTYIRKNAFKTKFTRWVSYALSAFVSLLVLSWNFT